MIGLGEEGMEIHYGPCMTDKTRSGFREYMLKLDEASALTRIESARQPLNEGIAFGDVARRYSDDSFSRDRGGELGFIPMEKNP